MAARLLRSRTSNAFSTTLNGSIDDAVTTVTLTSVTGLQAPGVAVIDRQDGAGNDTPSKREYITYTGISGNDLTGVTRGVAGSTAQSHSSGATTEETFSITHWNDLYDYLTIEHTIGGVHASMASTSWFETRNLIAASTASLAVMFARTRLDASGASLTGIERTAVWYMPGFASAATTNVMRLIMPFDGTFRSFAMTVRTPVSTASLSVAAYVIGSGASIFDTIGRPAILGGGTFVSTASIKTPVFTKGTVIRTDIETGGNLSDILLAGITY